MNRNVLMRLVAAATVLLLSGCAVISRVGPGETVIAGRLVVSVDQPWNRFDRGLSDDTPTWTIEGITVDELKFYAGLKDGATLVPPPANRSWVPPTFNATMQPAGVVALFQSLMTRDGSSFTLEKLEAAEFVGSPGFRFEFSRVRIGDDVHLRGIAYGAIRNGELYAISYSAPRLAFFPKYAVRAETLARSARVKG